MHYICKTCARARSAKYRSSPAKFATCSFCGRANTVIFATDEISGRIYAEYEEPPAATMEQLIKRLDPPPNLEEWEEGFWS